MSQLIADRFLAIDHHGVVDVSSAQRVDITIAHAGGKIEQQMWSTECAARLGEPQSRLIDFGFIGCDRRFEASTRQARNPIPWIGTVDHVIHWLEQAKHCRPDLFAVADGRVLVDGLLARELRVRGFVAVTVQMFEDSNIRSALLPHLRGRSVVLLGADAGHSDARERLANGFLWVLTAGGRRRWAVHAGGGHVAATRIAHAAEGRLAFGRSRYGAGVLHDAHELIARGRHALAERSLRAALAACERRDDPLRAADAALLLGRLLQTRGRVNDAFELFEQAREKYQGHNRPLQAIEACFFVGLAQTDRGLFVEAENILRTARSAAAAINADGLAQRAAVALARSLYWQGRYGDAFALLESCDVNNGEEAARNWCLVARLRLAAHDVANAWPAVARARTLIAGDREPAAESMVRTTEAMVQATLGDVEALERHVREGLKAAAAAHLPLQAIRLRLTLLEGLLDAGHGRARGIGARLAALSKVSLPPLLAQRMSRSLARLSSPAAHETAPVFAITPRPLAMPALVNQGEVDGLAELLAIFHDLEDERESLARGAATIKKHLGAVAVGVFSTGPTDVSPLSSVGGNTHILAERCVSVAQPIEIRQASGGYEGAIPIRYAGRLIGVLACRWSVDGPSSCERATAFCTAAAAACAPLVYALLQRRASPPVSDPANCEIIGVSTLIEDVRAAVARAANAPFNVLIEGESGSGKELVARAIHRTGCRRERKFCALNCAALPEDLVDAELFGHAKGAFTGAAIERQGLFESADQGTVFLDEVGELSPRAQAKLLRVLQEGEIRRIGETFTRAVDARVIAATNRSLSAEVSTGRFRQDLLYRLDVIRIAVPPLRERPEDVPLLVARFWRQAADRIGSKAVLGPGALSSLARYDWPGNVRELQNVLTSVVVAAPSRGVVGASHLPAAIGRASAATAETLDMARFQFEQRFVRATLARTAGHRGKAAAALGVSRQGLAKLLLRLGIE